MWHIRVPHQLPIPARDGSSTTCRTQWFIYYVDITRIHQLLACWSFQAARFIRKAWTLDLIPQEVINLPIIIIFGWDHLRVSFLEVPESSPILSLSVHLTFESHGCLWLSLRAFAVSDSSTDIWSWYLISIWYLTLDIKTCICLDFSRYELPRLLI